MLKHDDKDMPIIGGLNFIPQSERDCPVCGLVAHRSEFELVGAKACLRWTCCGCGRKVMEDLPYGHALFYPYAIEEDSGKLFGCEESWYEDEFAKAVRHPEKDIPSLEVVKHLDYSGEIIFLPCIDFLYGHSLLKLLQVGEHLNSGENVVLLVPRYLAWMVPQGVAQTWIVDIPLKFGQRWYPSLSRRIRELFEQFNCVRISPAFPHPVAGDPQRFTKVAPYERQKTPGRRVTFVWRDDRLWVWDRQELWFKVLRHFLKRWIQKQRILKLFRKLRNCGLDFVPTVVGVGTSPGFPAWIEDKIVPHPVPQELETRICEVYAQSLAVVGVHGSSMLLPSWHALSTFDLMPENRWGNFAQDILYRDVEPRTAAVRLRYAALSTPIPVLAAQIASMLKYHREIFRHYDPHWQNI